MSHFGIQEYFSVLEKSERQNLARHIQSAAESGWDFSSRWTPENGGENIDVMANLRTSDWIPEGVKNSH